MVKELKLNNGYTTVIDACRYDELKAQAWYGHRCSRSNKIYVMRNIKVGNRWTTQQLHRYLVGLNKRDGRVVDHADGNTLNNTSANLRVTTQAGNTANSSGRINRTGYKGINVRQKKSGLRYYVQLGSAGRKYHVGTFLNLEEAVRAYDIAAQCIFGKFARINKEENRFREDAEEILYIAIQEAKRIIEEEGRKADRRYGSKK